MNTVFSILAAIIPMMIYPIFVYWMDRYEKEPIGLLTTTFLWGFIRFSVSISQKHGVTATPELSLFKFRATRPPALGPGPGCTGNALH